MTGGSMELVQGVEGLRPEHGLHHYFLMRGLGARAVWLLQPVTRR